MNGYEVVVCENCGAGYADNIPGQSVFDEYYSAMSKYEHDDRKGAVSQMDVEIYRTAADLVVPHLRTSESIADIGCATGALLAEFKRQGFNNVIGFDPSPSCGATAHRLYNIEVKPATISHLRDFTEKFDVVLMTGVLEHLCDVESSMAAVINMLQPNGRLFIGVPDASHYHRWFSAPYQYFSMEHVNFFAPISLSNLMARHGLSTIFVERVPRYLGPEAVEPVILGLFERNPDLTASAPHPFDTETDAGLRAYIEASHKDDERINSILAGITESQDPLLVWGAGTHTLRLLENSPLAKTNILAIIDSNKNYHGKRLKGIPIIAPPEQVDPSATVLISSHVSEQEIKKHILNNLKWTNPLVCLYEGAPTELKTLGESLPMKLITIISGCYNEAENIREFVSRLLAVFAKLPQYRFEIIIIDNASTDNSADILRELAASHSNLKVILNTRNFGHIRSPYHALLQARGDAVIGLASDLQDPPEMIPQFLEKWEQGFHAVVGVKETSEETPWFFFVRKCYYQLVHHLADIQVVQNFTGFGLYDQAIVNVCRRLNDPYPYFRGIISEIGLSTATIPYKQLGRKRGITKNNFYTLYDLAMLGITNHSKVPLRLATLMGFAMSFLSLLVGLGYFVYKLLFWNRFSAGMAPVVIGLFLFSSVQLFFIGILGEYIGAIHTQVLNRPLVVEKERINFTDPTER